MSPGRQPTVLSDATAAIDGLLVSEAFFAEPYAVYARMRE
jgi:hypothetical protein